MRRETPRNIAASVKDRLRNLARERGEENQDLLIRYATERLLYRLSLSPYCERFILKGARLFELWTGEAHRPTRDIDFLGYGNPALAELIPLFQDLCRQPVPTDDGLVFPSERVTGAPARQDQEYQGASLKLIAQLGSAEIHLQIDFGFGGIITPGAQSAELPVLLDLPPPRLLVYPRETVVAEKLQAMVSLGIANSRMKDFYDIWYLANRFDFDGDPLSRAIAATFQRRQTELPSSLPMALTPEFCEDRDKQTQWNAFVRRSKLTGSGTLLPDVVEVIRLFLMPPLLAARSGEQFVSSWLANTGTWQTRLL
jgi:hypothetical protein